MNAWDVATWAEAIDGLRDRADELADWPMRLHVAGTEPADLLGGPRIAPEFWRWLTGSVHATTTETAEVVCPLRHDTSGCDRCGGLGSYRVTRQRYTRPLARALWVTARRKARLRPHPVTIVLALLSEGFRPVDAAARYGCPVVSVDHLTTEYARQLAAIRSVRNQYEDTVLGDTRPSWVDRSESQQAAEGLTDAIA